MKLLSNICGHNHTKRIGLLSPQSPLSFILPPSLFPLPPGLPISNTGSKQSNHQEPCREYRKEILTNLRMSRLERSWAT